MIDELKRLAAAATRHNAPHVGDCKGCEAKYALQAALSPERVMAMIAVIEAADAWSFGSTTKSEQELENDYDLARAKLEQT